MARADRAAMHRRDGTGGCATGGSGRLRFPLGLWYTDPSGSREKPDRRSWDPEGNII